jgi:hypothetical protein
VILAGVNVYTVSFTSMVLTTGTPAAADPSLMLDALPACFPPPAYPPPAPHPARDTEYSKQAHQAKHCLSPIMIVSYIQVTGCAYPQLDF